MWVLLIVLLDGRYLAYIVFYFKLNFVIEKETRMFIGLLLRFSNFPNLTKKNCTSVHSGDGTDLPAAPVSYYFNGVVDAG